MTGQISGLIRAGYSTATMYTSTEWCSYEPAIRVPSGVRRTAAETAAAEQLTTSTVESTVSRIRQSAN